MGPARMPLLSSLPQTRVGTVRVSMGGCHRCGWGCTRGWGADTCTRGYGSAHTARCEHTGVRPQVSGCVPGGARARVPVTHGELHGGVHSGGGVSHTRVGSAHGWILGCGRTEGRRWGVRACRWERTCGVCGVTHGWESQRGHGVGAGGGCRAPHPQFSPGTPGGSAGLEPPPRAHGVEKAPVVCFGSASDSFLADVAPLRCSGDPPTPSVRTPHPRPGCCLPTQGQTPRGRGWIYPSLLFCRGFIFTSHPALGDSIIRFKYYSAPRPQNTFISQGRRRSCPRVLGGAGTYPAAGRAVAAEGQLGRVFLPRRIRI